MAGSDGESNHEGFFFAELLFADVGEGDGGGDGGKYFGTGEFGLDFDARQSVELELLELSEGFGGTAFEEGTEFDGAFHLEEELLGVWVVEPAVLRFAFEGLGAEALEARVSVLFKDQIFGGAGGQTFFAENGLEFKVLFPFFGFRCEEGNVGGNEAVTETVGCGGCATFGGAGTGESLCVCLIGSDLSSGGHDLYSLSTFVLSRGGTQIVLR